MSKSLFERTAVSWDAILNMTKMELELIPDPYMYIFFEKGTRGGVPIFLMDIVKPAIGI